VTELAGPDGLLGPRWWLDSNSDPAEDFTVSFFSHPFVMTYPKNGHPTDTPRPQVFAQNLTGFSHGPGDPIGSVQDNHIWGADWGVLR
jgi:hypothetical protein